MEKLIPSAAQQIGQAAIAFQKKRTGLSPQSVTVVLDGETLVIILHGALSPIEKSLAKTEQGAAQVQEYHRHLFIDSADELRAAIERIAGVEVREANMEVEATTGAMVQVFSTHAMVQVFPLARAVPADVWSGNGSGPEGMQTES